MNQTYNRYSEAFKCHVVKEFERGKFKSMAEARQKYGKDLLLAKKVRIEMPKEQDQIKHLKARIKELEKALADTRVGEVINQAYFEIVCEEHGITDFEKYKKKLAKQQVDQAITNPKKNDKNRW